VGLRAKQGELAALRAKLAAMEEDLRINTRKKEVLEKEVELCRWGWGGEDVAGAGMLGQKQPW
jgi:dynein heavy chain